MSRSLLAVEELSVAYPGFRLGPLTLSFSAGRRVALVGPNGAGKSTTLAALGGRLPDWTGRILWRGDDLRGLLPEVRSRIGFLPERLPAYGWMTVREHLRFQAEFFPAWDAAYEAELLERLRLSSGARVGTLSRGTRVKLSFVAAEAYRPPVLVLDEPTSGLDPVIRGELLRLLEECVPRGSDRLLLFSSHILDDVGRICDRIIVIDGGRLREDVGRRELEARAPGTSLSEILHAALADRG